MQEGAIALAETSTEPGRPEDVRYQETWRQLYRFVYARVQNREEAEDLAQETYSRVLARFSPRDWPPSPQYLFTVVLNLIRDRWRRQRSRGQTLVLEESLLQGADDPASQATLKDALARLPAEYRQVLELRIIAGYTRAETAQRMGRTEDAVRGLQYRALQALRDRMQEQGVGR